MAQDDKKWSKDEISKFDSLLNLFGVDKAKDKENTEEELQESVKKLKDGSLELEKGIEGLNKKKYNPKKLIRKLKQTTVKVKADKAKQAKKAAKTKPKAEQPKKVEQPNAEKVEPIKEKQAPKSEP